MTVTQWLNNQNPEMKKVCKSLRETALNIMQDINEFIYHNAIGFSFTQSPFDRVFYIAVQNNSYVNFGFFFGADLSDPAGLLRGEGMRMRHVKLYTPEEAKNPELVKLIGAAWQKEQRMLQDGGKALKKIT